MALNFPFGHFFIGIYFPQDDNLLSPLAIVTKDWTLKKRIWPKFHINKLLVQLFMIWKG